MLTVVAAAAIAGAAWLAIQRTLRVGVVIVVGEYSIIELRIRVAIKIQDDMLQAIDKQHLCEQKRMQDM